MYQTSMAVNSSGIMTLRHRIHLNSAVAATYDAITGTPATVTISRTGGVITVTTVITPDAPIAAAVSDNKVQDINNPAGT